MLCMSEHTMYENCPARVEIELKHIGDGELEIVDEEIIEYMDVNAPILYCECGMEFEDLDSAKSHLRETSG